MRVCMNVCDGKGGERQQACGSVFCRGAAACRGSAGLSKCSREYIQPILGSFL